MHADFHELRFSYSQKMSDTNFNIIWKKTDYNFWRNKTNMEITIKGHSIYMTIVICAKNVTVTGGEYFKIMKCQ